MPRTVTFFQIGARVHLEPEAGHGDVHGELIGIGRRYLAIRLDGGSVDRRVWPSWVRRSLLDGGLTAHRGPICT